MIHGFATAVGVTLASGVAARLVLPYSSMFAHLMTVVFWRCEGDRQQDFKDVSSGFP